LSTLGQSESLYVRQGETTTPVTDIIQLVRW